MILPFLIFGETNYLLVLPPLFELPERDELLLSSSSLLVLLVLLALVEPLLLPVEVDFLVPALVEPEERFSSLEESCFSIIVFLFLREMVSVCFRYCKKRRAVLVKTTRKKKAWYFFYILGKSGKNTRWSPLF